MLGTEHNGMVLSLMASVYARKAKQEQQEQSGSAVQLAMYAFYDAMERTALAFNQVLDAKRTPKEAFDIIADYGQRLQAQLEEIEEAEESDEDSD